MRKLSMKNAKALFAALFALACCPGALAYRPAIEARQGMVVSSQRLASAVGVEILRQGGNAVDAAVAVGYAQAVVNPCCGNLGGGGFMLLHLAGGQDIFLDFRETAPARASTTMYLDAEGRPIRDASLLGWRAVGVPGTVRGLDTALRGYGRLTRAQVMAPAIRLARQGYVLTRADADLIERKADDLRGDPVAARIFFRRDGSLLQPGDRLVQKDLARTLAAIARDGADAFYRGALAARLAQAAQTGGGLLTKEDLAAYRVRQRDPVSCEYRGYRVVTAPPPSAGGVALCESLNILEGYDLAASGAYSAQAVHWQAEALRHAFIDRNSQLGDPDFVANPLARLLSKDYAAAIRARIADHRATPAGGAGPGIPPHESTDTTHYSVIDKEGNAAAVTYTLNTLFGAAVMAPGTGFLLNNEMDDFTVKPGVANAFGLVQGRANAIAPGKRPLSSMAPTLVFKDGRLFLALGSPGGSRIISSVLQVLLNIIDFGFGPQDAVDAPRIHHQWLPDEIAYETRGLSPDTLRLLAGMGHALREQTPWSAVELIQVGPGPIRSGAQDAGNDAMVSGKLWPGFYYGASDDRRPAGAALGY